MKSCQKKEGVGQDFETIKLKLPYFIDIVMRVADVEYGFISSNLLDREEISSIGIIALQVLLKDKSIEQLEKFNLLYLATAVRWAIRNELNIRYSWYRPMINKFFNDREQILYSSDLELQKKEVRNQIYQTLNCLRLQNEIKKEFYYKQDEDETSEIVAREITELWNNFIQAKRFLSSDSILVFDRFFSNDVNYADIENEISLEKVYDMETELKSILNKSGLINIQL